ncbi:hypothetical protein QM012_002993 [Aureobasidium pullulans]|uniref:Rhodopsin domain-containing protein n=1 Tax=Aureobasidium pullulans TaxID=5580 RepID=A0ABR0TA66_AURPU
MSTRAATAGPQALHDNRTHQLIAAIVIAVFLPTVFLALRLLARHVLRIRLYFDDWLIIIAWFFKIGIDISGSLLIQHGMGRHIEIVNIPDLVEFMQIQYAGLIQYPLCITFTKLSILYEYRRLFPNNHEFKLMTSLLIALMIMWCTAVVFTGIFICTPIRKVWNPWLEYGKCIDLVPFYYGIQIPNVVTDFLILLLPFGEVQRLKLPPKQKFGVALTCLLWIISLVFGVIRLAVLVQLSDDGSDITWNLVPAAIWTTIEPAVQITTACLPSLRVLYRKHLDHRKQKAKSAAAKRLRSIQLTGPRGVNV